MKRLICLIISVLSCFTILNSCKDDTQGDPGDSSLPSINNTEENTTMPAGSDANTTAASQETTQPVNHENGTLTEQLKELINQAIDTIPEITYVPEMNPVSIGSNIYAIYYTGMPYQTLSKTRVFAYIGFPEGASASNPVPAVVCVHGGGGQAYPDWVKKWTDKGYAAIAMDTYGKHPAGTNGAFIKDSQGGPDVDYMKSGNSKITDQWMYHAVSQAILAENLLRSDSRVIKDKIGITGISWGAHITANVIAHDGRFAFAVPVYGCAFLPGSAGAFADNFKNANAALLWDPSEELKKCKIPTLWLNGDSDKHFAVNATQKSFEATANGSILIQHVMNHSQNSGMSPNEIYAFADTVIRGGTPLALPVSQPSGSGNVSFDVNIPSGSSNVQITAYYLTTDITYNSSFQFTGNWKSINGTYNNGKVNVAVPSDATMYYVSISYKYNSLPFKTSTQLVVLK